MQTDSSNPYQHKILSELRQGSPHAFKMAYDMHAGRVYSFAFSLTKSREDSADLVQEVFVRLWENRGKIDPERPLAPLLFAIGKNLFVSAYRKRLSSQRYADYAEYADSLLESATPEAAMEYDEYRKSFRAAIRALPLRQRQIVHLSKFEGKKNAEIAQELNLSEQTVKNQLSLGLKALRLSLARIPLALLFVFFN